MLGSEPRQLLHAVEILEGVGEGLAAFPIQHLLHGDLFLRLIADGGDVICGDIVACLVLGHERVDLCLGDGVHFFHQIAHGPGVHLPSELGLDLHLVTLGDGHLPHVVAKAHDLHLFGDSDAYRGFHPVCNAFVDLLILPVPGDDLARHAQACSDEAVLPVAMGGLVEVHEVHVDLLVGDLFVVLGGQMAVGLLQGSEAVDPHLAGREGVAPGDDAGALVPVIGLLDHIGDLLVGLGGHLIHQRIGQHPGEFRRHFSGAHFHRFQNLRAIQELTADHEPEFILFHRFFSPVVQN